MKINIIGGGPAGLYFAILMKKSNPSHAEITRDFEAWDNVDVVHRDQKVSIHGNTFSGIARIKLLKILQRRCQALGVCINFRKEISDLDSLKNECDLLVGADGLNSLVRETLKVEFQPELNTRPNKYIWYGTRELFHGLTLTFRQSQAGVFCAHSYKFDRTTSTFIIECDPQTWIQGGFAEMSDEQTRSYLAGVFTLDLKHQPLLSNNSKWINFVLVKNARWHHENTVLLGDALHTAHFSIGSGTKLAMEDAIALRQSFAETSDVQTALRRFEAVRKPVIEDYQAAAYESMLWFENAREYVHLPPLELAYVLMTRSGRVNDAELKKRDPEFMAMYRESAG